MSEEISLVKGTIEIDSSKSVEATNAVVGALKEMAEQAGQTKRAISDVFKTLNNAGNRKGITGYAESMEKALEGVGESAKDAQDHIRTLNDFMKTTSKGGKFLKSKEELADVIAGSLMPQAKGFAKKEDRSGFGRTANTLAQYVNAYVAKGGTLDDSDSVLKKALKKNGFDLDTLMAISNEGNAGDKTVENLQNIYGIVDKLASTKQVDLSAIIDSSAYLKELHIIEAETTRTMDNIMAKLAGKNRGPSVQKDDIASSKTSSQRSADIKRFAKTLLNRDIPLSDDDKKLAATLLGEIEGELRSSENTDLRNQLKNKLKFKGNFEGPGTMMDFWDALRENAGDGSIDVEEAIKSIDVKYTQRKKQALDTTIAKKAKNAAEEALKSVDGLNKDQLRQMREKINGMLDESIAKEIEEAYDEKMKDFEWLTDEEIQDRWFNEHTDERGKVKAGRRNERFDGSKGGKKTEKIGGDAAYIDYLTSRGIDPYAREGFTGDLTDEETNKRALELIKSRKTLRGLGEQASKAYAEQETEAIENLTNRLQEANDKVAELKQNAAKMLDGDGTTEEIKNIINELDNLKSALGEISKDASRAKLTDLIPGFYDIDSTKDDLLDLRSNLNKRYGEADRKQQRDANLKKAREAFQKNANLDQSMQDDASFEDIKRAINEEKTAIENLKNLQKQNGKETWKFTPEELGGDIDAKITDYTQNLYTLAAALDKVATAQEEAAAETDKAGSFYGEASDTVLSVAEQLGVARKDKNGKLSVDVRDIDRNRGFLAGNDQAVAFLDMLEKYARRDSEKFGFKDYTADDLKKKVSSEENVRDVQNYVDAIEKGLDQSSEEFQQIQEAYKRAVERIQKFGEGLSHFKIDDYSDPKQVLSAITDKNLGLSDYDIEKNSLLERTRSLAERRKDIGKTASDQSEENIRNRIKAYKELLPEYQALQKDLDASEFKDDFLAPKGGIKEFKYLAGEIQGLMDLIKRMEADLEKVTGENPFKDLTDEVDNYKKSLEDVAKTSETALSKKTIDSDGIKQEIEKINEALKEYTELKEKVEKSESADAVKERTGFGAIEDTTKALEEQKKKLEQKLEVQQEYEKLQAQAQKLRTDRNAISATQKDYTQAEDADEAIGKLKNLQEEYEKLKEAVVAYQKTRADAGDIASGQEFDLGKRLGVDQIDNIIKQIDTNIATLQKRADKLRGVAPEQEASSSTGSTQSRAERTKSTASSDTKEEARAMEPLENEVRAVTQAVDEKTQAFDREATAVGANVINEVADLEKLQKILTEIAKTTADVTQFPEGFVNQLKAIGKIDIKDGVPAKIEELAEALTKLSESLNGISGEGSANITALNKLIDSAKEVGEVSDAIAKVNEHNNSTPATDEEQMFRMYDRLKYAMSDYYAVIDEGVQKGYLDKDFWDKAGVTDPMAYDLNNQVPTDTGYRNKFAAAKSKARQMSHALEESVAIYNGNNPETAYDYDSLAQGARDWARANQDALSSLEELSKAEKKRSDIERELATKVDQNKDSEYYKKLTSDLKEQEKLVEKLKTDIKKTFSDLDAEGIFPARDVDALIDETITQAGTKNKGAVADIIAKYKDELRGQLDELITGYGFNKNDNRIKRLNTAIGGITDLTGKNAIEDQITGLMETKDKKAATLKKYSKEYAELNRLQLEQIKTDQAQDPQKFSEVTTAIQAQQKVVAGLAKEYKNLSTVKRDAERELAAEARNVRNKKGNVSDTVKGLKDEATRELEKIAEKHSIQRSSPEYEALLRQIESVKGKTQQSKVLAKIGTLDNQKTVEEKVDDVAKKRGLDRNGVYRSRMDALKASKVETKDELNATLDEIDKFDSEIKKRQEKGKKALSHYNEAYTNQAKLEAQAAATTQFDAGYEKLNDALDEARNKTAALRTETQSYIDVIPSIGNQMKDVESTADATYDKQEAIMNRYKKEKEAREQLNYKYKTTDYGNPNNTQAKAQRDELQRLDGILQELDSRYINLAASAGQAATATQQMADAKASIGKDNINKLQGKIDEYKDSANKRLADTLSSTGISTTGAYKNFIENIKGQIGNIDSASSLKDVVSKIDNFKTYISKRQTKSTGLLDEYKQAMTLQSQLQAQLSTMKPGDAGFDKIKQDLDDATKKTSELRTQLERLDDVTPDISTKLDTFDNEAKATAQAEKEKDLLDQITKAEEKRANAQKRLVSTNTDAPSSAKVYAEANQEISAQTELINKLTEAYMNLRGGTTAAQDTIARTIAGAGADTKASMAQQIERYKSQAYNELNSSAITGSDFTKISDSISNLTGKTDLDKVLQTIKELNKEAQKPTEQQNKLKEYVEAVKEQEKAQLHLNTINKDTNPYAWDAQKNAVDQLTQKVRDLGEEYVKLSYNEGVARNALKFNAGEAVAEVDRNWSGKTTANFQDETHQYFLRFLQKYGNISDKNQDYLNISNRIRGIMDATSASGVRTDIDEWANRLDQERKEREELYSKLSTKQWKDYGYLQGKLELAGGDTSKLTSDELSRYNEYLQVLSKIEQKIGDITKGVSGLTLPEGITDGEISKIDKMLDNAKEMQKSKAFEIKVGNNPELQGYLLQINNLRNVIDGIGPIADRAENELAELNAQFAKKGDMSGFTERAQEVVSNLSKIQRVMPEETTREGGVAAARSMIEQRSGGTATGYKVDYNGNTSTVTAEYRDQNNMIRTLSASYNELDRSISLTQTRAVQGQTIMQQFVDGLKQRMMSLGQYLLTFVSFYDIINMAKQAASIVTDFDTAFTEMRKVSDESVQSLKQFQEESFAIGDSVGTTGLQIEQSTAEFMRLGQALEEAKESAKNANILFNVSEFDTIDEATESLIAMSQAFADVSQTEIIDSLNKIGNDFSISTSGLSEALQNSASALRTSGNDLAESLAILTAGNQVVQDPSKVGSGARTIALRLSGTDQAKTELAELGEETEGVITTVSKLRDTIMNATRVSSNSYKGFDILNENGNYKSTYEIIQGIADIWEEIGQNDIVTGNNNQNLLLEKMAGKNRSNILASMLQSPDVLRDAYEEAQDAAGSAAKENEKYIDSIEGRTKALKNQLQELATTTLKSGFLKAIVSGGTEALKIITELEKGLGLLGTAALGVGGGIFTKALMKNMDAIKKGAFAQTSAEQLTTSLNALGSTYSGFSGGDAQVKGFELFTKAKTAIDIGNIEYNTDQLQAFADALRSTAGDAGNAAADLLETAYGISKVGQTAQEAQKQTGVLSNMFSAFKANPIPGLIAAGTLAITVISGVVKHIQKQKQEAIQSASEGASEFKKTSDNVEESVLAYNSLYEAMASGNQTEKEAAQTKSELLSLQQQLVETYGAQAEGIDLVNGSYDEQVAKIKEIEEASARAMLAKNKVTGTGDGNFETAVEEMEKQYGADNRNAWMSLSQTDEIGSKILDVASKYVGKGVEIVANDLNPDLKDVVLTGTVKDVNKTALDLKTALQESDFYEDNTGNKWISAMERTLDEVYDDTDEILKNYEETYTQYLEASMITSTKRLSAGNKKEKIGDFYYDYMKAIADYQRAVEISADNDKVEEARAKVEELGLAWDAVADQEGFSKYGILIDGLEESLDSATIKAYEFKRALSNPTENSEDFNKAMNAIRESGATKDELLSSYGTGSSKSEHNKYYGIVESAAQAAQQAGFIDEVTEATVSWLLTQFENSMPSSYSGREQKAATFSDFLKGTAESDSEKTISDIVDNYQSAVSSIDEVRNKFLSESMTSSEFTDLLQTYPELAEDAKFMQEVTDNMDPSGFIRYSSGIESALKGLQFDKVKKEVKDLNSAIGDQQKELDLMITQGADQKVISAQRATIQKTKDYLKTLISTSDFSGILADDIRSVFYSSTFAGEKDAEVRKASQDQVFNLAKNGHAEAVATLLLETNTATWDYERWVAEIESKEIELKTHIDTEAIQGAASQIQDALSKNSNLKGVIDSAANREFNTDSVLDLINQFPLLTQNTNEWAAIIGSIDSDGLVTDVQAVSDLVAGMTFDNLSGLGTYFDTIAEKARINSNVFDDLRKKIIDLSDLSSVSWEDIIDSDAYKSLSGYTRTKLAETGAPTEVLAKIILKGDIDLNTLEQDIQEGIAQIEHRKFQAQISVLTTYNSDISSIRDAEAEIAQGTMTPDKALSLASSLPEVAKAAEELGLTFTDMNADEILDDVDKLQVALANAKFDRLERLLSDKNVGRAEKLSAIANADLSGNTRQNDYLARGGHVQNEWLANRLAGEGEFESTYGFGRESAYQTAVGVQMMLDAGSLENTEASIEQAFLALEPKVAIQLAEGSIRDIEQQITTISQVASDQMANGYVTQEQLNTLKAAGIDYSQMLEVGAKGWKLNTDKVQEYEDALRAVQVAQSKQTENIAKDRVAALDKEMKALLGESSDQAKMAEEAGKNAANNFVSGMSSELETAARGGTTAYGKAEQETAKTDIAERIQAGASAQDLLDEGYGFQDLAAAQNYLDLSDARAELEETIQKQQQYQMATAASIDIAKQFSEASSAANDRDLAETVSGGVKGALETKNKGWWGDKNLQQYAKFFADKDTPLYKALDEFESSWNNVWSKYYGSDGEITDDGVQKFIQDSVGKGLTLDSEVGEDGYTFDWLLKDVNIDELAKSWDTSTENIIALLSAFEDTRSWQQVDWSSIFGNSESIGSSTDAMQEYIDNLGILQKYNPDMDMGQYFETAAAGLSTLAEGGADSNTIQTYIDQLNQLAELTGQDYTITVTEDGNFDVVDTKLAEMKEHIDAIKAGITRQEGGGIGITPESEEELNELVEFANGEGKELMLSWGLKPNADGEFTVEDLADQLITFNWKLNENPEDPLNYGSEQGYDRVTSSQNQNWHTLTTETPTDPMENLNSGVDNIYSGIETANGYLATIAGKAEKDSEKDEGSEPKTDESDTPKDNSDRPDKHGPSTTKEYRDQLVSEGKVAEDASTVFENSVNELQESAKEAYEEAHGITEGLPLVQNAINANTQAQVDNTTSEESKENIPVDLLYNEEPSVETGLLGLTHPIGVPSFGHEVYASENEGGDTSFVETPTETEQTAENITVSGQTVQVNDDTNTPGTLSKGESVTDEYHNQLVTEGEESRLHEVHGVTRDPSLYSSTDYDFVGAHENGANPIAQIWDSLFGGSKESEQVETAVINATTAEVNSDTTPSDDTNTPGTLSKGESLTLEQRSEYSSTAETSEGEAYEPESQTSTVVINADVAELNANLPNETDPNYQPTNTMYTPDPLNYGGLQGYDRTQTPGVVPASQSVPYSEPAVATTPGELSASEVSVSGGSVTVSGPVEMPTSTPTETSTFTPTPTVTSSPAPEAPTTEATTKVTVEADVTPAEEAIAGLEDKTVTIGVQIETPQPEEFQGVLDRVSNSKPQSVQVDASVQDGATEGLQEVENKANEVDALNPTVTAQTQDNASSVLNSVISTSQEVDAQAPNVGVEATDNASSTLDKVKGLADDVESTDPNVSVSASTGNTISVLTNILNTVNQLPPSRIINITTKYNTIGSPPGQASGTFHPAQNLGTVKSAFADGIVGKLWDDYSRQNSLGAYARGTDVTLSRNQDALVNEVGVESIVFYVRTCTVMCMQLFIKLRGHPKANQATT